MKTGTHPFISKLNLFFKWGIKFDTEPYAPEDKGERKVHYTDKQKIEEAILDKFPESRKASNPVKKAVSGGQTLSEEDIAIAEKYSADGDLEPREPQPKKPKLKTSEE